LRHARKQADAAPAPCSGWPHGSRQSSLPEAPAIPAAAVLAAAAPVLVLADASVVDQPLDVPAVPGCGSVLRSEPWFPAVSAGGPSRVLFPGSGSGEARGSGQRFRVWSEVPARHSPALGAPTAFLQFGWRSVEAFKFQVLDGGHPPPRRRVIPSRPTQSR
jgi:hypothetical protein